MLLPLHSLSLIRLSFTALLSIEKKTSLIVNDAATICEIHVINSLKMRWQKKEPNAFNKLVGYLCVHENILLEITNKVSRASLNIRRTIEWMNEQFYTHLLFFFFLCKNKNMKKKQKPNESCIDCREIINLHKTPLMKQDLWMKQRWKWSKSITNFLHRSIFSSQQSSIFLFLTCKFWWKNWTLTKLHLSAGVPFGFTLDVSASLS